MSLFFGEREKREKRRNARGQLPSAAEVEGLIPVVRRLSALSIFDIALGCHRQWHNAWVSVSHTASFSKNGKKKELDFLSRPA